MRELTPELYAEQNKTINDLRLKNRNLNKENESLKRDAERDKQAVEEYKASNDQIKQQMEQFKTSLLSPKLNEIRIFTDEYFYHVFTAIPQYVEYYGNVRIDNEVIKTAIKAHSYIVWAYLTGRDFPKDSKEFENIGASIVKTLGEPNK